MAIRSLGAEPAPILHAGLAARNRRAQSSAAPSLLQQTYACLIVLSSFSGAGYPFQQRGSYAFPLYTGYDLLNSHQTFQI